MRFGRSSLPIHSHTGVAPFSVTALNSGATFRTSFLLEIGGVDSRFWLDYVDFYLFQQLSFRGARVFISQAMLQHDSASVDADRMMPTNRYANMRRAESLFMDLYRGFFERQLYNLSLLRQYLQQNRTFINREIPRITLDLLKRRCMSTKTKRLRAASEYVYRKAAEPSGSLSEG